MATEKQSEANRINARKSTGPRTDAGKKASRANAVKHGLTAETLCILADEDPAQLDDRVDAFFRSFAPRDEFEEHEVRRLALLSWKSERADRHEAAVTNRRVRERAKLDKAEHAERASGLIFRLCPGADDFERVGFDPASAASLVEEIESTAEGCRTLLDVWDQMRQAIDRKRAWSDWNEMIILRLSGQGPETIDDPGALDLIVASRVYMSRSAVTDADAWEVGGFPVPLDREALREACGRRPTTYHEAYKVLGDAIDRAVARLQIILDLREREGDNWGARESARLALLDAGAEGERLKRYQVATGREMDRIVRSIERRREKAIKQQMDEVKLAILRHKADLLGVVWAEPEPPILRNEPNPGEVRQECRTHETDCADCPAVEEPTPAVPEPPILRNEANSGEVRQESRTRETGKNRAVAHHQADFDLEGVEWIDIPSLL